MSDPPKEERKPLRLLPPPAVEGEVVVVERSPVGLPQKTRMELSQQAFREMEDDIAKKAMFVMSSALSFSEVEPPTMVAGEAPGDPPPAWEDELERMYPGQGRELARQKLGIAKAAWLSSKDAPVGLKMAQATALGLARVRAGDRMAARGLNVNVVNVIEPRQQYEELEVEDRKR